MHGRASFALLRHRILLGLHNALSPPKVRQSRIQDAPGRVVTRLAESAFHTRSVQQCADAFEAGDSSWLLSSGRGRRGGVWSWPD